MANLKYGEPTKLISFRIPVSKIDFIKEKLNSLLSESVEIKTDVIVDKSKKSIQSKCDCFLDSSGFLRRGKTKCSKPKSEHNFKSL